MLKITKGLNPKDVAANGISIYTDDKGDEYVRVKMWGEDLCIAAHDYARGGEHKFTWDDAMKSPEAEGLTAFTRNQVSLYSSRDCITEINDKLKEIGGEVLKDAWYWTSSEGHNDTIWVYFGSTGLYDYNRRIETLCPVRPILNL